jgi:hypothetical protein
VTSGTVSGFTGVASAYGAGGIVGLNQGTVSNSTVTDWVATGDRGGGIAGVNLRDLAKHDCAMSHGSADLYRRFVESRGLEKIPAAMVGEFEDGYQKVLKNF